jgi:hypothetical protein
MGPRLSLSRPLFAFVVFLLASGAPRVSLAAEMTRVASSFEELDPFDLDLDLGFKRTQRRGKITRERHQDRHVADVIELRFTRVTQELPFRLSFGLFHDLELHVASSMILASESGWGFPGLNEKGEAVTDNKNSTIANNCITPKGGQTNPNCKGQSTIGAESIFPVPGQAFRGGLDNVTVGLSWAPLNDMTDDTKPKWLWTFDYGIPSAEVIKPADPTTEGKPGKVGDKVHRFTLATALSKKLGAIDPYTRIAYTLPAVSPGAYSNCDNPKNLGFAENCGVKDTPWSQKETGLRPSHVGSLLFGAEFYAYDDPDRSQRVGFDIQFGTTYVSEGRTYNELSDALGRLLYTEEHLSVGGGFGIYARAAQYVQFKLFLSLYHDTEHFLTNEAVGKDLDGKCKDVAGVACVDLDNKTSEINPTFDFRYDMPGRRFRISEVNVFNLYATGTFNF